MSYTPNLKKVVIDRTLFNLDFIEQHKGELGPFETTQLLNSFLAAFIHPREQWANKIPKIPLPDKDWPAITTVAPFKAPRTVRQLVRLVRHALAHGNIELLQDRANPKEVGAVRLWNIIPKTKKKNWETELAISDLRKVLFAFAALAKKVGV